MFQLFPSVLRAKNQPALLHAGSEIQSPGSGFGQPVCNNRCNGVMLFYLFILGQKNGNPSVLLQPASQEVMLSSVSHLRTQ